MTVLGRDRLLSLTAPLQNELVLSVYIDGRAPDPASSQWRTALDHALRAARAAADRPTRGDFDRAAALVLELLAAQTNGLGAAGWVAFAGPREVFHASRCALPVPTLAVWGRGAHVAPYIRALAASHVAVLALVDARHAEVFEYTQGRLRRIAEIRAHHANGQPTHLGAAARPGFHVGTRGGTGRDRIQRALREGTARMEREAAQIVGHRAAAGHAVLIAGTPQHRRELARRLEETAAGRVLELESVDIHATRAQLAAAVEEGSDTLRRQRIESEVMAVIDAAGARGPAALGPETTRWALEQGRVQSLYITPRFLDDHPTDAEALVRAALAQHAAIDFVGNDESKALEATGGVAARLRYRLV